MAAPLFELGLVVATPGALAEAGAFDPAELLERHQAGDWGDLNAYYDRRENERALRSGARIFSAYQTPQGRVWIITEATDDQRECGARRAYCSRKTISEEVGGRRLEVLGVALLVLASPNLGRPPSGGRRSARRYAAGVESG